MLAKYPSQNVEPLGSPKKKKKEYIEAKVEQNSLSLTQSNFKDIYCAIKTFTIKNSKMLFKNLHIYERYVCVVSR